MNLGTYILLHEWSDKLFKCDQPRLEFTTTRYGSSKIELFLAHSNIPMHEHI